MEKYKELQNFSINEVDFIELQYGTVAKLFRNSKSYKINLETKSLDVIYYTQEELNAMQQQNQEAQDLNSSISNIESSILEIEENKILERMM